MVEEARASHCSVLSQGYISNNDLAGQCWYGGARKDKIVICLGE